MQDIRVSIERLTNELIKLRSDNDNLKLVMLELIADSKIERSDKLLSAAEAREKLGVNDRAWAEVKRDQSFPKTQLTEGGHTKYSDKAVDAWITNKQIFKKY